MKCNLFDDESHEYSIMERFIWSLPEGTIQDRLENAIRGRGAFRRFKDSICWLGIEQNGMISGRTHTGKSPLNGEKNMDFNFRNHERSAIAAF